MSDLTFDLPKALALASSETASKEIRALGGIAATAIHLHGIPGTADPEILNVIEKLLDDVQVTIDRLRDRSIEPDGTGSSS